MSHPSSTIPAPPALSMSRTAIAVLALLTAVAPLAIDMYLPAFPDLADDLGTSATGVQLSLTAFLVGLGLGQLLIGPLSDGIGRRTPLLAGSVLCLLATVVCAVAPDISVLIGARFVQGLSGAAGVVLARAMISDTTYGAVAAKLLGVLMVISVIAPVAGPLVGGGIIAFSDWRGVFWFQAAVVLLMTIGAFFHATETLPVRERSDGGFGATLRAAGEVLRNRNYVGYLLTFSFSFAALFAYIAASPFVIQNILGFSEGAFTLLFSLNALAITATSAAAAGLAGRVTYRRMIAVGLVAALLAGVGLLWCVLGGVPTAPTLVLFAVFQGSLGLIFGNATTLALAETEAHAGTGSAFLGFLQFTLAAAISPLVGIAGEDTGAPMGVAIVGAVLLAGAAYVLLTQPAREAGEGDREI